MTTATRRIAEGPPRGRPAVTLLPPGADGRQPGGPRGGTRRDIGYSLRQRGRSDERVRDIDWVQHRGSCEAFQHDTGRVVDPVAARATGPGLMARSQRKHDHAVSHPFYGGRRPILGMWSRLKRARRLAHAQNDPICAASRVHHRTADSDHKAGRRAVISRAGVLYAKGAPNRPVGSPEFLCTAVQPRQRTDLPRIARWVKPDVVSAAGCRIDEHLEQWPAQASSEPVIPDRPEVAPEATSTDTSH
jgi:hypothetical protein